MAGRTEEPASFAPSLRSRPSIKKNSSLLDSFHSLWQDCCPPALQSRVAQRAQTLALSSLLCLGRHTVTNLLSTAGVQFQDWSAAYRLFSESRLDVTQMFSGLRSAYLRLLPETAPLCLAVDDSLLPKTGTKIPGTAWRRDPQGPPFQTNLIRAQRVLQFSALLPLSNSTAMRAVPVAFLHAPTAPKLKKNASQQQKQEHEKLSQQLNLSTQALNQLEHMRPDFGA